MMTTRKKRKMMMKGGLGVAFVEAMKARMTKT
jgi:hypothetical protein